MKCKCGGNLKRIAIDCYKCDICGTKQAIAFAAVGDSIGSISSINSNQCISYEYQIEACPPSFNCRKIIHEIADELR